MDNQETTSLSLNDLQQVLNIFDVCTQRSAFKAAELEAVGRLYNHLSRFVKQNTPAEKPVETESSDSLAADTADSVGDQVNASSEDPKNL